MKTKNSKKQKAIVKKNDNRCTVNLNTFNARDLKAYAKSKKITPSDVVNILLDNIELDQLNILLDNPIGLTVLILAEEQDLEIKEIILHRIIHKNN